MNILFIDNDADPPYFGGTTTLTRIQADALEAEGHNCFLGYLTPSDTPSVLFNRKVQLSDSNAFENFLSEIRVDYVYNQMVDFDFAILEPLRKQRAFFIHAFDTSPTSLSLSIGELYNRILLSRSIKQIFRNVARICLFPIFNYRREKRIANFFQRSYNYCDRYVLLSESQICKFKKYVPYMEPNKVIALTNPVTYDYHFDECELKNKEKTVLVVSRFSHEKRLDHILSIWHHVEKSGKFNDWKLVLIGGGPEENVVLSLIKKYSIKNIELPGIVKAPIEYYCKAAIFLMTSKFEGWPMSLMECQQFGDVPIVYNSFEAANEIVIDHYNGFLITNSDKKQFFDKLVQLMSDEEMRNTMALHALEYANQHSKVAYKKEYLKLFTKK